ncbi:MAG: alpha/beta hydrolase [Anaerolineales bacterium]
MKKMLIIIASILIVCIAVAAVGGYFAYQSFTGPLYQPGDVRAGKDLRAPLDPPPQPAEPGVWLVEPDIRLHYFTSGEGKPVLVLHGGPGFPFLKPWSGLQGLTDVYRFHYYDQRGSGESTRPFDRFTSTNYYENMTALNKALGLGAQVADVERIRRILGAEKITLIGQSFGAFIAALYATEFPERVEKLILVSPADMLVMPQEGGGLFPLVQERLPESRRVEFETFLKEYLDFQNIFKKSEADLIAMNDRLGQYYSLAYPGSPQASPEEEGRPGGWMVWGIYLSLGQHHDYRNVMKSTAFPVLILHGADDLQSEETTRQYIGIYPNAEFTIIPGATHFAFEENAAEFARVVKDFMG